MTIDSILAQTMQDWELIIVNDGSTDKTKEYLDTLIDPRIWVIHRVENWGIQRSYNQGFLLATGEYITFISSDNYYFPTYLEKLSEVLDKDLSVTFVYSAFNWMDMSGMKIKVNYEQDFSIHRFLVNNPGVASVMIRGNFLREFMPKGVDGSKDSYDYPLDPEVGLAADTDFWIRMMEHPDWKIKYVPHILCYFMSDTVSDSVKNYSQTFDSIQKVVKKFQNRRKLKTILSSPSILFVNPNFISHHVAGVEVYTYNLIQELKKYNLDVSVLIPAIGSPGIIEESYEGIKVYRLTHQTDLTDPRLTIENPELEHQFLHFLDTHGFDIIHFHHTIGFSFSLIRMAKKCGYPVCLTLHDFWFLCHKMYLQDWEGKVHKGSNSIDECVGCYIGNKNLRIDEIASIFYILAYRTANVREILDMVDVLTCPSKHVYDIFTNRGLGYGKMEISELGINKVNRVEIDHPFTIGYIGMIHPLKNLSLLVKVFSQISNLTIQLRIWGSVSKEYRSEFFELIRDDTRISYMGEYKQSQLGEVLGQIDIMVNPSLSESYSLTTHEALSASVPVISSSGNAMAEVSCGVFTDEGHLRWMLETLIGDPKQVEAWRRRIRKIRTIEQDAWGWVERYRKLL